MGIIKEGESDLKTIFTRILRRDFSGKTGLAIKNSTYQFSYNLISKLGSLIFVIALARLILPETFGLYSLTLSTIMFFYIFSDLGVNQAIVYFSSRTLHKNRKKAKGIINYLLKIKISLSLISAILLVLLAGFISQNYYQKPIFMPLIAGSIYLFFTAMQSFYMAIAQSNNDFRSPFIKEISLQLAKIILIPAAIIYFSRPEFQIPEVLTIFTTLSLISIFCLVVIYKTSMKNINLNGLVPIKLTSQEKKESLVFMMRVSLITSSILLLGTLDKIIIGPFVPPEYIGYYAAAFSLVSASAFLITFADVFFPIFLRMKGKELQKAFKKSTLVTFIFSLCLFVVIASLAPWIVRIVFGSNYLPSVNMLRALALMVILYPLIEIYTSYVISKGKLNKITKLTLLIVALSVIFPLLFVKLFLASGPLYAVFGLIIGILLSKLVHLGCLFIIARSN